MFASLNDDRSSSLSSPSPTTSTLSTSSSRYGPYPPWMMVGAGTAMRPVACSLYKRQKACGSFIPNQSGAAMVLRTVIRGNSQNDRHFDSASPSDEHNNDRTNRIGSLTVHTETLTPHFPSYLPPRTKPKTQASNSPTIRQRRDSHGALASNLDICTGFSVFTDLHPILAKLEKESKLCTGSMQCSTCGKAGVDFPSCVRCSETWCSRECRLAKGKRHSCQSRVA